MHFVLEPNVFGRTANHDYHGFTRVRVADGRGRRDQLIGDDALTRLELQAAPLARSCPAAWALNTTSQCLQRYRCGRSGEVGPGLRTGR